MADEVNVNVAAGEPRAEDAAEAVEEEREPWQDMVEAVGVVAEAQRETLTALERVQERLGNLEARIPETLPAMMESQHQTIREVVGAALMQSAAATASSLPTPPPEPPPAEETPEVLPVVVPAENGGGQPESETEKVEIQAEEKQGRKRRKI